jgi:hypothetical protein
MSIPPGTPCIYNSCTLPTILHHHYNLLIPTNHSTVDNIPNSSIFFMNILSEGRKTHRQYITCIKYLQENMANSNYSNKVQHKSLNSNMYTHCPVDLQIHTLHTNQTTALIHRIITTTSHLTDYN